MDSATELYLWSIRRKSGAKRHSMRNMNSSNTATQMYAFSQRRGLGKDNRAVKAPAVAGYVRPAPRHVPRLQVCYLSSCQPSSNPAHRNHPCLHSKPLAQMPSCRFGIVGGLRDRSETYTQGDRRRSWNQSWLSRNLKAECTMRFDAN